MALRNNLRTVTVDGRPVGRKSDKDIGRDRSYLTPAEVERLIATAKRRGRYGQRDALAILMCYRHGLRVSELVDLRWSQVSWEGTPRLTVRRRKGSISGVAQALGKDEVRPPDPARAASRDVVHLPGRARRRHRRLVPAHAQTGRRGVRPAPGPPAHAPPRLRLRAGRQGPRPARDTAAAGAQGDIEHDQVRRAAAGEARQDMGLARG